VRALHDIFVRREVHHRTGTLLITLGIAHPFKLVRCFEGREGDIMDSERGDQKVTTTGSHEATGATTPTERPRRRQSSSSGGRQRRVSGPATARQHPDNLAATLNQLLSTSRRTFANRHFEVAYHVLAAALHAAQDLNDEQRLEEIEVLAHEQMRIVDADVPVSPLSTTAATYRGMVPLWVSLARQAETARRLCRTAKTAQRQW
jgi:hypothetical protein